MRANKSILLLTLLLVVSLPFSGCGGGGGGNPTVSPTTSGGYTTRPIDFTDDFSKSDSGWGTRGFPSSEDALYYGGGMYVMQLYSGAERRWNSEFKSKLIGDYTLEVAVKNGKDTNALGGIYFNDGAANHNVFVIMPKTQKYSIATEDPADIGGMDWRFLKQVNKGLPKICSYIKKDEYNVLKVEVKGDKATLTINGYPLDEILTVPLHQNGENVGLYLSNNIDDDVKMEYDNFHVKGTELIRN